MLSGLFQAICQVGIFMICAQTIVHFKPNGSYEKYLKMLVSVMLLIQIFLPITRVFTGDVSLNIEQRVAWFEQSLEEAVQKAAKSAVLSENTLERMTLEEVLNEEGDDKNTTGEAADTGAEKVRKVERIRVKVGKTDEAE